MRFHGQVTAIPPEVEASMRGASWREHERCPAFGALALVQLSHHGMDGAVHQGELVIAAAVADDVVRAFERIFAARFPIERMVRIDAYAADDDRSMADNNSSGFCFRNVAGTGDLSLHAFGTAIDINPLQNPYIKGERVCPPGARAYLDRADVRPGMIVRPDPVTEAFDAIGWEWGGDWTRAKDYQHFAIDLRVNR
ncbi:MAG TPA: M15 family metallopeptidase [Kofleriaceae bacterium]|nr:M15 family metallopeptidase [Kofleriaceae bacterium]